MTNQTCSECGHINHETATHCVQCNSLLSVPPSHDSLQTVDGEKTTLDLSKIVEYVRDEYDTLIDGKLGASHIPSQLVLTHEPSNKQFHINQQDLDEIVIGRKTKDTGDLSMIDLSGIEGDKNGVSRRHASLIQKGGFLMIIDHNSSHGTYLNGERIIPEQARIIRDNDTIRLGIVVLRVNFGD